MQSSRGAVIGKFCSFLACWLKGLKFLACCVLPNKKFYGNCFYWCKYVRDFHDATQCFKSDGSGSYGLTPEACLCYRCCVLEQGTTHQAPVVWKLAQVQAAGPRYVRGPAYDILVLHFKCQPLSDGLYVFLYKLRNFVQVSSNQKHIFIMFADVRCGQESISKQLLYILPAVMVVLPAVTHAFRRVRK